MCASSYYINGGDGAETANLQFKSETPDSDMVWENGLTGRTWFLGTGRPTFDVSACTAASNEFHGSLYHCPSSFKVRPLQLFTPNRGTLTVTDSTHGSGPVTLTKRANNIPAGVGMGLDFCPAGRKQQSNLSHSPSPDPNRDPHQAATTQTATLFSCATARRSRSTSPTRRTRPTGATSL
jgi:hypothetical protein